MRKLFAALAILFGIVAVVAWVRRCRGWAVVSLDQQPELVAGDPTDIGFTLLRHGVTPESSEDVVFVLTGQDGTSHRFTAVPEGAVGHHVVTIDLPSDGDYHVTVCRPVRRRRPRVVHRGCQLGRDVEHVALGRAAVGHRVARRGDGRAGRVGRDAHPSPRACLPPRRDTSLVVRGRGRGRRHRVAAQRRGASRTATREVAADGAGLFGTKGCATCHDGPDGASPMGAGPSLVDVAAWAGDRMPDVSAADYVELSIRNPSAFISPLYTPIGGPAGGMPLLQLSDERDRRDRGLPPRPAIGVGRRDRVGRTHRPSGWRRPPARRCR